MNKYLTILIVILLFSITVFAQDKLPEITYNYYKKSSEKTYILQGTLKNQNSGLIAGANLYFEKDGQTNVVPTNINGEFKTELSKGDYKIKVSSELSSDFIAFIKIQENELNPSNIDFTIKTISENNYPKPTSLPIPIYPAAAKAVGITGEVVVSVKIDKEGKVVSATAEISHPLLRQASEKAALNSMFESVENIESREAKLTYVFLRPLEEIGDKNKKRFSNQYRIETFFNEYHSN